MFRKVIPALAQPTDELPASSTLTRRDALLNLLRNTDGASIEDLISHFGWKPHSARAMLTGLRKAGHDVQRDKVGSITVYRVSA